MGEVFGPYLLEEVIGRGGMGEVYRAVDTAQNRTVAVKLLPEALSADEDFRKRFRREAEVTARLNDPHVIPIHRYGEIDGRLYLDMRFVVGEDLGRVLARERVLTPARTVGIVEQVASALDTAHEAGLIHRDVKPSNVLLAETKPGRAEFAYLADFGIARAVQASTRSALTGTGATVGTVDYMAPERFLGKPVDHRVDVYSLACLLSECVTGMRPFPAGEAVALLHAHLYQPPPKPSAAGTGVPAAFDAVVARGMAKEPGDRFATAGDLAVAAREALESARSATDPRASAPPWAATRLAGDPWALSTDRPPVAPSSEPRARVGGAEFPVNVQFGAGWVGPSRRYGRPAPARAATDVPPAPAWFTRRRALGAVGTALLVVLAIIVLIQRPDATLGLPLPLALDASDCSNTQASGLAAVAVTCTFTDPSGPSSADFARFTSAAELEAAFVATIAGQQAVEGDAAECRDGSGRTGVWTDTGSVRGMLGCFGSTQVWTNTAELTLAVVRRADGNRQLLYDWWSDRNLNVLGYATAGT